MADDDPLYAKAWAAAYDSFCRINPANVSSAQPSIDLTDLGDVCAQVGINLNQYELTQAMYDLDTSGEMVVRLEDFAAWLAARLAAIPTEEASDDTPVQRLWEHVIETEGNAYYYDYITGDVVYALPDLVDRILKQYDLPGDKTMDEKLTAWFRRFDVDDSGSLDSDEWRAMLVVLGIPVPTLKAVTDSMREVAGEVARVSFEALQAWWYRHAPQRTRCRLADFVEWTETKDENGAVYYTNDRTQATQWDPPALVFQMHAFLEQSPGATAQAKMDRLFASLDTDSDLALSAAELHPLLKTLGYTDWSVARVQAAVACLEPGYDLVSQASVFAWWQRCTKRAVLGDWEEYTNESGQTYYYNPLTQQTQWEPPQVTANLQALLDKFSSDSTVTTKDKIRRLFVQYDTDKSGALDPHELRRICAAMGQTLDDTDMAAMIKALDTSGDGVVSLDEFQAWWLAKEAVETQWEAQQEAESRADQVRRICATYLNVPLDTFARMPFDSNAIPRLVQALGRVCRGKALLEALRNLDPTGSHVVDSECFVQWYLEYDKACTAQEVRLREEKRAQEAVDAWIEETDATGKKFYVNSRTQERMWEKPGIKEAMQTLLASVGGTDVRAIFRRFDEDDSGSIDAGELKHLLMALGQPVTDEQLPQILSIIDTGGDGFISLDEFTTWWVCMQRRSIATSNAQALADQVTNYHAMSRDSIRELRKLFDQFDTDHSGSIDEYELKHLLARLNWFPSDAERHRLMQLIDTSGDGQMSCDEFIAWWVTVHRELDIKRAAQANGHLLADAIAASNAAKEDTSLLASLKGIDFAEVSLSSLRDKLSDFKYRLLAPKLGDLPPEETTPDIYEGGRPRFLGSVNVTAIHPAIVETLRAVIDDVVLISPLMIADAAQRIQKMYRSKRARRQLIQTLNDRYVHHIDRVTGASYYMNRLTKEFRFDKPPLLGDHEILTPRTALREKHTALSLRRRRLWLEKVMTSPELQGRSSYRSAAFFFYDVLCSVKARLLRGVWPALLVHNHTLAQLVVRRYPRQLKRLGPHMDFPLHYALRETLPTSVILSFLEAHEDVVGLTNAAGHTPLHLLARVPRRPDALALLDAFLAAPQGIETCTMVTKTTLRTPLHLALLHHCPVAFLRRLMTACPAALRLRDVHFKLPVHVAIQSDLQPMARRIDIVHLCIENGSSLDPVSENAFPLHFALVQDAPDAMVHFLLDVQPTAVGERYRRLLPVFMAMKYRRSEALMGRLVTLTLERVAAADVVTHLGFNPLHYALLYKLPSRFVLGLLQTHREWTTDLTRRQEHPLHLAAMYCDDLGVISALLEAAPLATRQVNHAGCLPLHLAVLRGADTVAKVLLHVCPWVLLERIKGTKYDALLLAAKVRAKWPNSSLVDLFLSPPPLAPTRPKYKHLDLTPYYVAATSRLTAIQTFDKLHMLDQCNTDDLEAIARKKLRAKYYKPTEKWDFQQIITLMARNPIDAAVQLRSLLAINQKVSKLDEASREMVIETYDIVRTIQYTMYEFTANPRVQILGGQCLNHLLPTPYAKAKYQSRVDPLYKF
ncbi:hypothetical protein ACHHYP_09293 [Achlya hypogyna]|uniref:Uncharacterized protein n=1 Tax=Achlya hypogyna TaxID=1202772 RepID=A0A1V9ZJ45_ACHHY|nr:hypothetical protein ACHHYP_09293 [Achlya hypogyna]